MRYEVEAKQYTLRVYPSGASTNWVATAQIWRYGDRGWVSSISSPKLFDAMPDGFDALMQELGLVTMEGYMSDAMARALRIKSRGWAKFDITHRGKNAGRDMPWVVISCLQEKHRETHRGNGTHHLVLDDCGLPT